MARPVGLFRGREVLAVHADATDGVSIPRLSGRLPNRGTLVGEGWTREVRYAGRGALVRVVANAKLVFEPGASCSLDGEDLRLLLALDTLDPSRRSYLGKKLADARFDDAERLARRLAEDIFTGRSDAHTREDRSSVSPAARSLYDAIRATSRPDTPDDFAHLTPIRKRGLAEVAAELLRVGLIFELENGHLIDRETYRERLAAVGRQSAPVDSQRAAHLWGCSHGRARAILHRMVHDEFVFRDGAAYVAISSSEETDA